MIEYRLCVEKFGSVRRYPRGTGAKGRKRVAESVERSFEDFLRAPEGVRGNLDAWAEEREVSPWGPISDSPQD